MQKLLCVFSVFLLTVLFFICAEAEELTTQESITHSDGVPNPAMLCDGDQETSQPCRENASLTLEEPQGISGLYLIFDKPYGTITLSAPEGEECLLDTGGILHYFVDVQASLGGIPERLTLCFSDGEADFNELRLFGPGAIPDWVQRWEKIPDGQTDLMLFSAHGDDEQLFFTGLLPWYGAELGYRVQVVYFTDHRNLTSARVHEMLNGLWAVGIRDYPVFGAFADYYTFDLQDAYAFYDAQGQPEETLLSFFVENLRRGRPKVAVTHDPNGEYGHGMHQLCADLMKKAVAVSADPERFPELTALYGTWDVPKTYLHLYPENLITMDWDIPMESFDGKTAFEVTRDLGFAAHDSQQKDFAWYFRGVQRAADIPKYSPCFYGLYRSTVGEDIEKNDLFENLRDDCRETTPAAPLPDQSNLSAADRNWLLLPAVGTAVLTILTTGISANGSLKNF